MLWAKPSLATWKNAFGYGLHWLQAFCYWFAFAQPARAKSSPADPRDLQPGVSLAQDVSITKLSKPISSDRNELKSQRRQFIYCWMLDITANKHQRQESQAGDEKSCPVMRGYEPFLSYLFGFHNEQPDVAAAAHTEQPVLSSHWVLGCPGGGRWTDGWGCCRETASSVCPSAPSPQVCSAGDGAALQQGGCVMMCGRTSVSSRIKEVIFASLGLTSGMAMCFFMPWMGGEGGC